MQDAYFFLLIFFDYLWQKITCDYENIVLSFSGSFYK